MHVIFNLLAMSHILRLPSSSFAFEIMKINYFGAFEKTKSGDKQIVSRFPNRGSIKACY